MGISFPSSSSSFQPAPFLSNDPTSWLALLRVWACILGDDTADAPHFQPLLQNFSLLLTTYGNSCRLPTCGSLENTKPRSVSLPTCTLVKSREDLIELLALSSTVNELLQKTPHFNHTDMAPAVRLNRVPAEQLGIKILAEPNGNINVEWVIGTESVEWSPLGLTLST